MSAAEPLACGVRTWLGSKIKTSTPQGFTAYINIPSGRPTPPTTPPQPADNHQQKKSFAVAPRRHSRGHTHGKRHKQKQGRGGKGQQQKAVGSGCQNAPPPSKLRATLLARLSSLSAPPRHFHVLDDMYACFCGNWLFLWASKLMSNLENSRKRVCACLPKLRANSVYTSPGHVCVAGHT